MPSGMVSANGVLPGSSPAGQHTQHSVTCSLLACSYVVVVPWYSVYASTFLGGYPLTLQWNVHSATEQMQVSDSVPAALQTVLIILAMHGHRAFIVCCVQLCCCVFVAAFCLPLDIVSQVVLNSAFFCMHVGAVLCQVSTAQAAVHL